MRNSLCQVSNSVPTFKQFSICAGYTRQQKQHRQLGELNTSEKAHKELAQGEAWQGGVSEGGEGTELPGAAVVAFSLKHRNLLRCAKIKGLCTNPFAAEGGIQQS